MSEKQTYDVHCLVCGGRGGWWSNRYELIPGVSGFSVQAGPDERTVCTRCNGDGWEPSESIRRVVRGSS